MECFDWGYLGAFGSDLVRVQHWSGRGDTLAIASNDEAAMGSDLLRRLLTDHLVDGALALDMVDGQFLLRLLFSVAQKSVIHQGMLGGVS